MNTLYVVDQYQFLTSICVVHVDIDTHVPLNHNVYHNITDIDIKSQMHIWCPSSRECVLRPLDVPNHVTTLSIECKCHISPGLIPNTVITLSLMGDITVDKDSIPNSVINVKTTADILYVLPPSVAYLDVSIRYITLPSNVRHLVCDGNRSIKVFTDSMLETVTFKNMLTNYTRDNFDKVAHKISMTHDYIPDKYDWGNTYIISQPFDKEEPPYIWSGTDVLIETNSSAIDIYEGLFHDYILYRIKRVSRDVISEYRLYNGTIAYQLTRKWYIRANITRMSRHIEYDMTHLLQHRKNMGDVLDQIRNLNH